MRQLILGLVLAGVCACKPTAPPPAPPQTVVAIAVTPRPAALTAEYVGTAEAVDEVEIRPRVSGLLERRLAVEGQRVRKGQALFTVDRQPFQDALQQAEAGLAQARANAQQVDRDYARAQALAQGEALSQQELDAALAKRDAGAAGVKAAEAAVSSAQTNLGYTQVVSPIDGVMGRAELKEGALLSAFSSLLTTVYATDPMHVNISLSEADLLGLESQMGHRLDAGDARPLPAKLLLSDGSEYPAPAKVDFVAPAVDPQSGTLAVRLRVANPKGVLRAGQFVRVVLTARQVPDAILVPQRAIQDLQDKHFVWVVDAEHKAQQRDVTVGQQIGADVVVVRGLAAGDSVVVEGAQRLKAGAEVQIKAPAEPAAAAAAPAGDRKP